MPNLLPLTNNNLQVGKIPLYNQIRILIGRLRDSASNCSAPKVFLGEIDAYLACTCQTLRRRGLIMMSRTSCPKIVSKLFFSVKTFREVYFLVVKSLF